MKSEQETFEKINEALSLNMEAKKRQDIWNNIVQEMNYSQATMTRKKQGSAFKNVFAGGAGLLATIAVVVGLYTFDGNKVYNELGLPIPKTAQQAGKNTVSLLSLPRPTEVKFIKWSNSFSGKPNHTWTNTSDATLIDQVVGWLGSAQVIEDEPVAPVQKSGKPGITIVTQNGTSIDVSLAYNVKTLKQSNGTSQISWTYEKGYLVVSGHGFQKPVRIYSLQLANWIWNGWSGGASVTAQSSKVELPKVNTIQSITVSVGTVPIAWVTQNPKNVSSQVLSWLDNAIPYVGNIPPSFSNFEPQGGVGSARLNIVTINHNVITIYPTYYLVKIRSGSAQTRYVPDVLTYQEGNRTVYLTSPQLYNWLKNSQWKTEFSMPSSINLQNNEGHATQNVPHHF